MSVDRITILLKPLLSCDVWKAEREERQTGEGGGKRTEGERGAEGGEAEGEEEGNKRDRDGERGKGEWDVRQVKERI